MSENLVSAVLAAQEISDIKVLIDQAAAKMPFMITLTPKERQEKRKMGSTTTGYVGAVLTGVTTHTDALPVNYQTTEFTKDKDLQLTMSELIEYTVSKLLEPMRDTDLQLRHELIEQADHGHALLKTAGKSGNAAVKTTLELIAQTLPDTGKRYPAVIMDVGSNACITVSNTVPGTRFINIGDAILEVGVGPDIAEKVRGTTQRVLPGSSIFLPKGYTQIFVKNLSTEQQGQFTVKVKSV
jgi:hypothetical protein